MFPPSSQQVSLSGVGLGVGPAVVVGVQVAVRLGCGDGDGEDVGVGAGLAVTLIDTRATVPGSAGRSAVQAVTSKKMDIMNKSNE